MIVVFIILLVLNVSYILCDPKYSLVLVGGALDANNTEVWSKIIELGGGQGKARFGVIAAASEDPCCDQDSSYTYYAGLFKLYGAAESYYIPITIDTKVMNSDPTVIENIQRMTGFFFGGGDQTKVIESFYNGDNYNMESAALKAIKDTLDATGGVVAGTSAGTDCQTGKVMITCGYSYEGLDKGVQIYDNIEDINVNSNKVIAYSKGGIGLFDYGLLDTHYAERGRHGRSMAMLMDTTSLSTSSKYSFNIDQNTAFVVTNQGTSRIGTVLGERSVFILDSSLAKGSLKAMDVDMNVNVNNNMNVNNQANGRSILGMKATRLTHNDMINLSTNKVTFASYKLPLTQINISADDLYHSKDIFESDSTYEFDKVVDSLLQSSSSSSSYGVTKEKTPKYKIVMDREYNGMSVVAVGGTDPDTKEYEISYDGLWLSVVNDGL